LRRFGVGNSIALAQQTTMERLPSVAEICAAGW
jgi:hypothetical protein